MLRIVIVAVLCCASVQITAFEFADCGSKLGRFTEVSVSGCETSQSVCVLKRGTNATIEIQFIVDQDIKDVRAVVFGVILDVPVPFPIPNSDACSDTNSGLTCPLAKGGEYRYKTSLPVSKKYPTVRVNIKWELLNEANEKIVCVLFPAALR
ncbi:protein NPC2 homolog [Orussus abietinus]|uniref:protein NPC2 homolog n=1 Tax=Orussus abietinus TaxID=222816 RepID=UPI000625C0AD|nr:protein NPC2 homolog [Orussus abietinus]